MSELDKSLCDKDTKASEIISNFLDNTLYDTLVKTGKIRKYERVFDKKRQFEGVDVIFYLNNGHELAIDEKYAVQYINCNLHTFAMELSTRTKDKSHFLQLGWFLNDELSTDYYILVWPCTFDGNTRDKNEIDALRTDELTCIDVALVSKDAIRTNLYNKGYSKDVLMKIDNYFRENDMRKKRTEYPDYAFYYCEKAKTSSGEDYMSEEPMSILIPKKEIMELATRTGAFWNIGQEYIILGEILDGTQKYKFLKGNDDIFSHETEILRTHKPFINYPLFA